MRHLILTEVPSRTSYRSAGSSEKHCRCSRSSTGEQTVDWKDSKAATVSPDSGAKIKLLKFSTSSSLDLDIWMTLRTHAEAQQLAGGDERWRARMWSRHTSARAALSPLCATMIGPRVERWTSGGLHERLLPVDTLLGSNGCTPCIQMTGSGCANFPDHTTCEPPVASGKRDLQPRPTCEFFTYFILMWPLEYYRKCTFRDKISLLKLLRSAVCFIFEVTDIFDPADVEGLTGMPEWKYYMINGTWPWEAEEDEDEDDDSDEDDEDDEGDDDETE
ncbi:hypothetical protein Aperf_G00000097214 [Anoplocephala perfoliata]